MTTNSNIISHDLVKSHNNGYPSFTGQLAYTGFDSFEQAENFAKEIGGELHSIYHRNGQSLLESRGQVWASYTADDYVNDLGDNYSIATEESVLEAISCADDNSIEELNVLLDYCREAKSDEVVISGYGKYFETVPSKMIKYNEDVHNWEIGVVVEKSQDDE